MFEDNVYELLYMIHAHDAHAFALLYERFKPFIYKKFAELNKITIGLEFEDAVQAGFLGLNDAVYYYRHDKGIPFESFVMLCIDRSMQSLVNRLKKMRETGYLSSYSLDKSIREDDDMRLEEVLAQDWKDCNLEMRFLTEAVYNEIKDHPEDLEIFKRKSAGYSYKEIAEQLNLSVKKVDNCYQRIRHKIIYVLENDK